MASEMTLRASAKINLALHVVGQRDDGYHELESLVVFADIGDELSAEIANHDGLEVAGPFAKDLKNGATNLITKAILAFREEWPNAVEHGVHIRLEKNLPVASGIGGGSADAAAALRIMAAFSKGAIPPKQLAQVALRLGADVPLCLFSQTCIARGIGEIVQPITTFPDSYLVLVNPLQAVATPDIFKRLRHKKNDALPPLPSSLTHHAVLGLWMAETRNDLEAAAIELLPVIADIKTALAETTDCVAARMSGSGATVFGLYGSQAAAHDAAHEMLRKFPDYWVTAAPII